MNGVHDMGGMHGLGPIDPERNEPLFHEPWEARALALTLAMGAWGKWNIDASRHERELIPGDRYLSMSYYEKWIAGLIELMINRGLVTREEVQRGRPAENSPKATPPVTAAKIAAALAKGDPYQRESSAQARFNLGQSIRTRNINPGGHTRMPRFARDKLGLIERQHGVFVFPDSNAHFLGESPQHLYSVRFEARELWGAAGDGRSAVFIDLWEEYLEPV